MRRIQSQARTSVIETSTPYGADGVLTITARVTSTPTNDGYSEFVITEVDAILDVKFAILVKDEDSITRESDPAAWDKAEEFTQDFVQTLR